MNQASGELVHQEGFFVECDGEDVNGIVEVVLEVIDRCRYEDLLLR